MKLLSILLTAILCATASAQTIKSLGYNSTNGQVVANTGTNLLTFNDSVKFDGGIITGDAFAYGFETLPNTAIQITDDGIDFTTTNAAATTRTNLGFNTNLNTLWTATNAGNARSAIGIGSVVDYATGDSANSVVGATIDLASALWDSANDVAALKINDNEVNVANNTIVTNFRSALGLGLPALTNTSNVTMMRALAGSTNTNEPYSGTIALTNTNVLTFSNGVLLKIQ